MDSESLKVTGYMFAIIGMINLLIGAFVSVFDTM
jgi:hypothetical protein